MRYQIFETADEDAYRILLWTQRGQFTIEEAGQGGIKVLHNGPGCFASGVVLPLVETPKGALIAACRAWVAWAEQEITEYEDGSLVIPSIAAVLSQTRAALVAVDATA